MSKATDSTPAVFIEQTRAHQILQYMIHGKSISDIATIFNVPQESIRRTISQERLKLTAAMQEMQEQWMGITYARTEWLLSKVMEVIDKQTQGENLTGPDKNLLKAALEIMKFQKEVVVPDKVDRSDPNLVINQTFVGGSAMYDEAMRSMQYRNKNSITDENPPIVVSSPVMDHLEELAKQYLPEGVFEDDEQEDETP